MIPKIIHYVWLGGGRIPPSVHKCINSWKKNLCGYEIKLWNENNFDCESVPLVKEALIAKKYAFAADYIRLYALYTEGGIYLDTDVLVRKSFDAFLDHRFVGGTEAYYVGTEIHFRLEAALIASEPGHPFINECLKFYKTRRFVREDGSYDTTVIQSIITDIACKRGYCLKDEFQSLEEGMTIFPTNIFGNNLYKNTRTDSIVAIHQNVGSWIDYSSRGTLYKLFRRLDLMSLYHKIEHLKDR